MKRSTLPILSSVVISSLLSDHDGTCAKPVKSAKPGNHARKKKKTSKSGGSSGEEGERFFFDFERYVAKITEMEQNLVWLGARQEGGSAEEEAEEGNEEEAGRAVEAGRRRLNREQLRLVRGHYWNGYYSAHQFLRDPQRTTERILAVAHADPTPVLSVEDFLRKHYLPLLGGGESGERLEESSSSLLVLTKFAEESVVSYLKDLPLVPETQWRAQVAAFLNSEAEREEDDEEEEMSNGGPILPRPRLYFDFLAYIAKINFMQQTLRDLRTPAESSSSEEGGGENGAAREAVRELVNDKQFSLISDRGRFSVAQLLDDPLGTAQTIHNVYGQLEREGFTTVADFITRYLRFSKNKVAQKALLDRFAERAMASYLVQVPLVNRMTFEGQIVWRRENSTFRYHFFHHTLRITLLGMIAWNLLSAFVE